MTSINAIVERLPKPAKVRCKSAFPSISVSNASEVAMYRNSLTFRYD